MAFTQTLSTDTEVSSDESRLYIRDITGAIDDVTYVYNSETEEYDEVTNDTGYGDPNAERAEKALFLVVYLKATGNFTLIEYDAVDPVTVDTWAIQLADDGWYKANLISVDAVSGPAVGSYADDEAVYDTELAQLLQRQDGAWVEIGAEELLDTAYDVATTDRFITAVNRKALIDLNAEKNNLLFSNVNNAHTKDIARLRARYQDDKSLLEASIYEFCRGNKTIAQRNIEFLSTNKSDV